MFEEFNTNLQNDKGAKIKVIGVGGGGNNAVNKMVEDKITGIEFIVANTDNQVLKTSKVPTKLALGEISTKGLGAGALPEIGKKAAEESIDEIKAVIEGADLVFVAAGMGGGTGTGAAPIIAKAAKDSGSLVIGIVTTPFNFEGKRRSNNSIEGLKNLSEVTDSIIVISNDRLLDELGEIPLTDSFKYSDAILKSAIRTISDLIQDHSLINLDFADVKTVIEGQGAALIGVGSSTGENAAVEAAIRAINSPILESSIEGAKNAIVSVAGSSKSLSIKKAQSAVNTIKEASASDIEIMFGVTINESLEDEIVVSVIATGLNQTKTQTEAVEEARQTSIDIATDIDKFKQQSTTREFSKTEAEAQLNQGSQDEIFSGFNLLDEDDDDSFSAFLKRE